MKIALVYSDDFSLWIFRRGLIRRLIASGFEVVTISTAGKYVKHLEGLGATHKSIHMRRFMNPVSDLRLLFGLYNIFREERFSIVHTFTVKPNIFGSMAAYLAGVEKIVISVTGLGYAFSDLKGTNNRLLRFLVGNLYRLAFKLSDKVWFQNDDERCQCVGDGMVAEQKTVLISSSGVDLRLFSPEAVDHARLQKIKKELRSDGDQRYVSMVGRAIWSKGVAEFAEAAEILQHDFPAVKFLLVGGREKGNPENVPVEYLLDRRKKNFAWLGHREDVRELIALSELVVLPSHREGAPRALLEAMAMGKPIVTTSISGCKKLVDEGKNGYCVPVKNAYDLAGAIAEVLGDEERRRVFGYHSRAKAEQEFDEELVVEKIFEDLYELPSIEPGRRDSVGNHLSCC